MGLSYMKSWPAGKVIRAEFQNSAGGLHPLLKASANEETLLFRWGMTLQLGSRQIWVQILTLPVCYLNKSPNLPEPQCGMGCQHKSDCTIEWNNLWNFLTHNRCSKMIALLFILTHQSEWTKKDQTRWGVLSLRSCGFCDVRCHRTLQTSTW